MADSSEGDRQNRFPLPLAAGGSIENTTMERFGAVWSVRQTPVDKLVLLYVAGNGCSNRAELSRLAEFAGCTEAVAEGSMARLRDAGYIE